MVELFLRLDKTVQVAIITLCGGVLVAIINGVFFLFINRKKKVQQTRTTIADKVTITQTSNGNNNSFIGIQNNGKDDK